jgi:PAS domain S-box-containing protein
MSFLSLGERPHEGNLLLRWNLEAGGRFCQPQRVTSSTPSLLLSESATILESILATAPVGLGVLDRELRFVHANEALARGNGVTREEHLGRTIMEIWPTIPPELVRRLRQLLTHGEALIDDEAVSERDGHYRYVLGSYYPVLDGAGGVLGIGVVVSDITARTLAEEALRSSERRLRELLENVQLVAVSLDLDGRITYCNPYLAEVTGWERDELLGRDWYDTFTPPERESHRATFLPAVVAERMPAHSESTIRTRDDGRRTLWWNNTVIRDPEGRPVGATSIGEDVTERRRAERALQALAAEQAALRHVATVVAAEPTHELLFETVATEVGRLFGAQSANLIRDDGETLVVMGGWSETGEGWIAPGSVFAREGDSATHRVVRTQRPARVDSLAQIGDALTRDVWLELGFQSAIAAPVIVDGRLWGAISVTKTTEEVFPEGAEHGLADFAALAAQAIANAEAHEELRASRARIVEAADQARRRLERNLHDGAQQRLVSVSVALRLALARIRDDPAVAESILRGAGEELAQSLAELRELARGLHPAVLTDRGLVPALEALAARAPLPVELRLEELSLPGTIEAAAYYVVAEALTNVAKYASASAVHVSIAVADAQVVIEVADDGVGGAQPAHGTGLRGLRDRVDALDGRLEIESAGGQGTRVRAIIPLSPPRRGTGG